MGQKKLFREDESWSNGYSLDLQSSSSHSDPHILGSFSRGQMDLLKEVDFWVLIPNTCENECVIFPGRTLLRVLRSAAALLQERTVPPL